MDDDMVKCLADTIIWIAKQRIANGHGQNINSAIVAVCLEADQILMDFMSKQKGVKKK